MRFVSLGSVGEEIPAPIWSDVYMGIRNVTPDIDRDFLSSHGVAEAKRLLRAGDPTVLTDGERFHLGAPIAKPGAVVCAGIYYGAHAVEAGMQPPAKQSILLRAPNTVSEPTGDVAIPTRNMKAGSQAELGVVSGRRASCVRPRAKSRGAQSRVRS